MWLWSVLLKKEILDNVQSFRFLLVVALFGGLLPLSFFALARQHHQAVALYRASEGLYRDNLQAIRQIPTQHDQADAFNDYGLYAAVPPRPLALLVRGVEDIIPVQVNVCSHFVRALYPDHYRSALFALFTAPDLAFIVQYLASLVALFFTFDAVAAERGRGTLRLLFSQPVPRPLFLLGKWVGSYLCLAVPFGLALGGCLTYAALAGALVPDGETAWRLSLLVAVSLLYIGLFCSLGLLLSTLFRQAATALLVGMALWVGCNLAIPDLAVDVARAIRPAHSLAHLALAKRQIPHDISERRQRLRADPSIDPETKKRLRAEIAEDVERWRQSLEQTQRNRRQRQQRLGAALARISPAASYRLAVTALAGTGLERYQSYLRGFAAYDAAYHKINDAAWERFSYRENHQAPAAWLRPEEMPRIDAPVESLADALDRVGVDIALLALYAVALYAAAHLAFLRQEID